MSSISVPENSDTVEDSVEVVLDETDSPESQEVIPEPSEQAELSVSSSEEELEEYSGKVKKRIDKLTGKYRESERREQAALDFARGLQTENKTLQDRITNLDKGYRSEFTTRIDSQITEVQSKYKQAYESGDVDIMVEAQTELSALSAQKERITWAEQLQQQAEANKTKEVQPSEQKSKEPDLVAQIHPKAKQWAEDNTWFGDDEAMTYSALGFHRTLTERDGYSGTEDDYYVEIDRRMKEAFPHKYNGQSSESRPAQSVASATRKQNSGRPKSVRLTSSERDIAKRLGVSEKDYAVQKLRLTQ
jgi:hypothetical protein